MLSLETETPATVEVQRVGSYWTVKTASHEKTASAGDAAVYDRIHAHGYLSLEPSDLDDTPLDLDAIKTRCQPLDLSG
jgi:hypothetical protein